MKRALSLILALAMLTLSVVACGAKTEDPAATTTAPADEATTTAATEATTTAATEETLPPELADTLPDVNFTGETFKVLIREESKYEMTSEEITGDLVRDAVYNRELTVEERLGLNIEVHTIKGNWDYRNDFIAHVNNSILSNDHSFDMAMTHNAYLASMILRGQANRPQRAGCHRFHQEMVVPEVRREHCH